jgi:hypothetical protein
MHATDLPSGTITTPRRFGDQDARALEHRSRCVMIAGRGYRARSADMAWVLTGRRDGHSRTGMDVPRMF